jgi:predicted ribosomally synthesized peptide with SipW-like signal peptide
MEGRAMKDARARKRTSPARLLMSLAAVALVGVVGVVGTQAALSATTDNPGNEFNAGEITLSDNDAGAFLYNVDNALPGDPPTEKCISVSYTSTPALDSTVVLYMDTSIGDVGPYVDLVIEAGTQTTPSFPNCSGFVSVETLYTGTLEGFQSTYGAAGSGLAYSPHGVGTPWVDGDAVIYKVSLTMSNRVRLPGENFSGVHTYTWQATSV